MRYSVHLDISLGGGRGVYSIGQILWSQLVSIGWGHVCCWGILSPKLLSPFSCQLCCAPEAHTCLAAFARLSPCGETWHWQTRCVVGKSPELTAADTALLLECVQAGLVPAAECQLSEGLCHLWRWLQRKDWIFFACLILRCSGYCEGMAERRRYLTQILAV